MKHCKDYKKLFSSILLTVLIISTFAFSSLQTTYAQSATADDITQKINQRNADIAALEKEIKAYQAELNSLGQQKNTLGVQLKELDINRKKLIANISITQKKIDETSLKIQNLSSDIGVKEKSISSNNQAIATSLRAKNEYELDNELYTLLSKSDFTEVWNDLDNIATVRDSIRAKVLELKQIKGKLEDTRVQTMEAKKELTTLKNQLADQKKIVDQNTADKNKLLAQTKNSETSYQKLLKDRLAKKTAFEKEISDYESQLKYILDPKSLPNAGTLSWPMDNIFVTQLFGKTQAGKRLYASGSHNGVDFRASVGTPIKALADGVVAGSGDTDVQCPGVSFGRFILIKYDNGLAATFGHLSLIKVSAGQRVSRGEIVGYSGNTGYSTGPHLHVSVYARDAVDVKTLPSKSCPGKVLTQPISAINAYLDPMFYLPPYKN